MGGREEERGRRWSEGGVRGKWEGPREGRKWRD